MTRSNREFKFISKYEQTVDSASELMKLAGLDWTVSLNDLYAAGKYDTIEVPGKYATVKTDQNNNESVLSVVGSRYKIFQNQEIFSPLDNVVKGGSSLYGAAGELGGGKVVWAVLQLKDPIHVGNDEHMGYIVARTSHDGTTPFQMTPMVSRIACTNQINTMMSTGKQRGLYYSVRHSTNAVIDNDIIVSMYRKSVDSISSYGDMSRWLVSQSFNDNQFRTLVSQLYPMPSAISNSPIDMLTPGQLRSRNRIEFSRTNALRIWQGETQTQTSIEGTKFAAFQSIVEAVDWDSRRGIDKAESAILLGKDYDIKFRALELLRS